MNTIEILEVFRNLLDEATREASEDEASDTRLVLKKLFHYYPNNGGPYSISFSERLHPGTVGFLKTAGFNLAEEIDDCGNYTISISIP